jgi:hypothetical protein
MPPTQKVKQSANKNKRKDNRQMLSFNKECKNPIELRTDSKLPYLMFDVNMPVENILQEISQAQDNFYNHREDQSKGWSSLVMHGQGDEFTNAPMFYDIQEEDAVFDWTNASNSIPSLKQWLLEQNYFIDFDRIRIMSVAPGGYIESHRDYDKSRLGPINIAINNPEGCEFVMEDVGVVPFKQNKGAWLDLSNKHSVRNNSNEHRYHIILHGGKTTEFKKQAYENYRKLI